MIARHWRGWTLPQDADAYERLLKETVLPGLKTIKGYRGGYVFRKDGTQEVEFVVVNYLLRWRRCADSRGRTIALPYSNLRLRDSSRRPSHRPRIMKSGLIPSS